MGWCACQYDGALCPQLRSRGGTEGEYIQTMPVAVHDYVSTMKLLRKIGDENAPGSVSCNDFIYSQRERLLGMIVAGLLKKNPVAVQVAPMIIREDTPMTLIARRISWIMFQEQFPITMRWAVHRDPFYSDTGVHLLPDVTRASIQTYRAAAERRYRGFIRKARNDMKLDKKSRRREDPFVNPLPSETLAVSHSSSQEDSSSSQTSSSRPIISRNLRTTRGVTVATAPSSSDSVGFSSRRRV